MPLQRKLAELVIEMPDKKIGTPAHGCAGMCCLCIMITVSRPSCVAEGNTGLLERCYICTIVEADLYECLCHTLRPGGMSITQ